LFHLNFGDEDGDLTKDGVLGDLALLTRNLWVMWEGPGVISSEEEGGVNGRGGISMYEHSVSIADVQNQQTHAQ
jgi:hypothetical protein